MATFTWKPSRRPSRASRPRVRSTRFGDGYEQRYQDGLNANLPSWDLNFNGRPRAVADAIDAFLAAHGGAESFDWTDPRGVAGKFICREWRLIELGGDLAGITATFEQVPA
ncbi:MAG: phage tail protein [Rhodocyclaceae bacterium]|nr:phage tail protein [Rhodocyclaceae bacterium]